jgi:hypothetical protein
MMPGSLASRAHTTHALARERARVRATSPGTTVAATRRHELPLLLLVLGIALLATTLAPAVATATNFTTNQNAALVLGSTNFTSTNRGANMSYGFDRPYGVQLDSTGRVLVGDFGNNRLAVFNSLPAANGAAPHRTSCCATSARPITEAHARRPSRATSPEPGARVAASPWWRRPRRPCPTGTAAWCSTTRCPARPARRQRACSVSRT